MKGMGASLLCYTCPLFQAEHVLLVLRVMCVHKGFDVTLQSTRLGDFRKSVSRGSLTPNIDWTAASNAVLSAGYQYGCSAGKGGCGLVGKACYMWSDQRWLMPLMWVKVAAWQGCCLAHPHVHACNKSTIVDLHSALASASMTKTLHHMTMLCSAMWHQACNAVTRLHMCKPCIPYKKQHEEHAVAAADNDVGMQRTFRCCISPTLVSCAFVLSGPGHFLLVPMGAFYCKANAIILNGVSMSTMLVMYTATCAIGCFLR
jgi:hypothetical protein